MYPNPQDVVPLPGRANLEQYKKQAKDLVNACRSGMNWACEHGRTEVAAIEQTYHGAPLQWALHGWSEARAAAARDR